MSRKIKALLLGAALCGGCMNQNKKAEEAVLWCATDIHFLSQSLYDRGAAYDQLLRSNDGKLFEYSAEIMEKLTEDIIAAEPDAFLFCGDLTFNGEMESLQELKTYLVRIEEAGIPVLAIPGNHDISYPYARAYYQGMAKSVPDISTEEFIDVMGDFGYRDGIARDEYSASFVYELRDDLWILAMDANTVEAPGSLRAETKEWIRSQLDLAKEKGITVVTMSHQNVLKQNAVMYKGYVMNDFDEVQKILKNGGVFLNLSGHSHLQHTSAGRSLTDICNESLSVWPLSYGIVTVTPGTKEFTYTKDSIHILEEESRERFDETVLRSAVPMLAEREVPEDIRQEMLDYAVEFNELFYTGQKVDINSMKARKEYEYWRKYAGDSFWFIYMKLMIG